MDDGFNFTFPALRGIQAGQEYYVAMCPLRLLPRIFLFDESEVPPELRAQRSLNTSRIPEIKRYILDNRQDYAFSAITASVDGFIDFQPISSDTAGKDIGRLVVSMNARFIINDGQHRRAAIEAALEECPELGDEKIAVVFYVDTGLTRSKRLFADLNKHVVRPSRSLQVLYEDRATLALLAQELTRQVPCFQGLTELEKTTISNRSTKLFTLGAIHQATIDLLGRHEQDEITPQERENVIAFWKKLSETIPEWALAAQRKVSSAELRRDYVHVHSVTLQAIGQAGHALLQQHPHDWEARLEALRKIDWSRANVSIWEGRAMQGGQMSKASKNIRLTANYLRTVLGLELSAADQKLESQFRPRNHP